MAKRESHIRQMLLRVMRL